jgi:AcrR family transcriptional regulator
MNAAEALLRERPFRELTVDEVMRRTDLSRPSFYVYFRDRHQLILRVIERLGGEQQDLARLWYTRDGAGPQRIREALEAVVASWARDGPLFNALADAAADDHEVDLARQANMDSVIQGAAEHIETEIELGHILPVNPYETARALTVMSDSYLTAVLGREQLVPTDVILETIATIFIRTLYGEQA